MIIGILTGCSSNMINRTHETVNRVKDGNPKTKCELRYHCFISFLFCSFVALFETGYTFIKLIWRKCKFFNYIVHGGGHEFGNF